MKAIKSGKLPNKRDILKRLQDAALKQVSKVERQYEDVVATWRTKPTFQIDIKTGSNKTSFEVGTDNDLFHMLDEEGSPPHSIRAVRAKTLRYRDDFRPQTKVRSLSSKPGGKFGEYVFPISVVHPGFEARKWSEEISSQLEKNMVQDIEDAMDDVLRLL